MNWGDNLMLAEDTADTHTRGHLQLSMYALHLAAGNNIHCRSLRLATIEQYVLAASSLLAQFSGVDYRKEGTGSGRLGPLLSAVYREHRRYEAVPDRREPYDLHMHRAARAEASNHSVLTLIPSLTDWFEVGLMAGLRLSEWAQPSGKGSVLTPTLHDVPGINPRTRALIADDVRALTTDLRHARGLALANLDPSKIAKMWVKFRVQKNGQHGEERLFVPNPTSGGHCFVSAMLRILRRFDRVRRLDSRIDPSTTPLSVCWDAVAREARLIVSSNIDTFMRYLASKVYHIDPIREKAALQKWGSHSLRVGACVLLHAMDFSTIDIQWMLRWRSQAFMVYLRNISILPRRQAVAFDRAAAMPHLI